MTIDLDLTKYSDADLIDLNRRIVAYISAKRRLERARDLARFHPGDRVWFRTEDGLRITGVVVRINQKTISIHTDDHHDWRVSPHVLHHADLSKDGEPSNIVELGQL